MPPCCRQRSFTHPAIMLPTQGTTSNGAQATSRRASPYCSNQWTPRNLVVVFALGTFGPPSHHDDAELYPRSSDVPVERPAGRTDGQRRKHETRFRHVAHLTLHSASRFTFFKRNSASRFMFLDETQSRATQERRANIHKKKNTSRHC